MNHLRYRQVLAEIAARRDAALTLIWEDAIQAFEREEIPHPSLEDVGDTYYAKRAQPIIEQARAERRQAWAVYCDK